MVYVLIALLFCNTFLCEALKKQSFSYKDEEIIGTHTFIHEIAVENNARNERFLIDNKEVNGLLFEEQLAHAEREENKKKRQKKQEERLKLYEARYRGTVKLEQKELAIVLKNVEDELARIQNNRLKPFLVFPSNALTSEEDILALYQEQLPQARTLQDLHPDSLDIAKLQETVISMKKKVTALKKTFIATVNNALEKADDTHLLKDLLNLF